MHKHTIAWENSRVITINNRYAWSKTFPRSLAYTSDHALNRDDGAYLPEEYMQLIGR